MNSEALAALTRTVPPAAGWAIAGAGLGTIAVLSVMVGPRLPAFPVGPVALALAAGWVGTGGAITAYLRSRETAPAYAASHLVAHGLLWVFAAALAGLAALEMFLSAAAVPDYAQATVGLSDGAWPPQWRAFAFGVTTMGPVCGMGTAVLLRRAGIAISARGIIATGLVWMFAWLWLFVSLLFVVALVGGVTAPVGHASQPVEIPVIVAMTMLFSGLAGLVAGWIGETVLARFARQATFNGR